MATHPAFPSVLSHAPSQRHTFLPDSSEALYAFIQSCDTLDSIRSSLIPSLHELSLGTGLGGENKSKAKRGEEILSLQNQDLSGLEDIDFARMTAGLVYVISARLDERLSTWHNTDTFDVAVRLCNLGDESQLQSCGPRVGRLAWGLLDLARELRQTRHALQALRSLLDRASRRGTFTAVHTVYLEACLLERTYFDAQPIIDEVFLDLKSAQPNYLDVITYYHHAGLISIAIGDYARARGLLIAAVSAPTSATSAIQVACAKRAILCELLVSGKAISFPKYTSSGVMRSIERTCQEYQNLAKAFEAQEWGVVRKAETAKDYERDSNLGLLREVLDSVTKRRILRQTMTYSRMSLGDLATKVDMGGDLSRVEIILGDMIGSQAIVATITAAAEPQNAVVAFHENTLPENSAATLADVMHLNDVAGWLEAQLSASGEEMGLSEGFLKKQAEIHNVSGKKGGAALGGGGGKAIEDLESAMMAEEFAAGGRVGADYGDMGY